METHRIDIMTTTELTETTITTARMATGIFTLISNANGEDVLVTPNGNHVDLSTLPLDDGRLAIASTISLAVLGLD